MDRGVWRATVHGVAKSWIRLRTQCTHTDLHWLDSLVLGLSVPQALLPWISLSLPLSPPLSVQPWVFFFLTFDVGLSLMGFLSHSWTLWLASTYH